MCTSLMGIKKSQLHCLKQFSLVSFFLCMGLAKDQVRTSSSDGILLSRHILDTCLRQYTQSCQKVSSGRATRRKGGKSFLKNGKLLAYHNLQTIAESKANDRFCFTWTKYITHLKKAIVPPKSRSKNICYMCGANTCSMCRICRVPLCTNVNSEKRDCNGSLIPKFCHSNYHNYELFGLLGRGDYYSR